MSYVKAKILSQGIWDGIFYDMVYDAPPKSADGAAPDLDGDGRTDNAALAREQWLNRAAYLLEKSYQEYGVKYIVINGISAANVQNRINGRMYETFPTPWEAGGNWGALMAALARNQNVNVAPRLYVFNANTNNTGNQADYRKVRFGLASSLMVNYVYFGFDYGDTNHAQTWWYDEYDINLGKPADEPMTINGYGGFKDGVWLRAYENGLAVVNATNQTQTVDLGAEYEKIIGQQDAAVNDGAITDKVTVPAKDGLLLLKTTQKIDNLFFGNGYFLRFYKFDGRRARNGFFAFENNAPGGAQIFNGDLNGDGSWEKIVAHKGEIEIFNDKGERWNDWYPFGGNFSGELNLAVGRLDGGKTRLLITGSRAGRVIKYTYNGEAISEAVYPLGKNYFGGFSAAIINGRAGQPGQAVLGTLAGRSGEVLVMDNNLKKIIRRFYPFGAGYKGAVAVAVGDYNGDGKTEIAAVMAGAAGNPLLRIFDLSGKKLREFKVGGALGAKVTLVGAQTKNGDNKTTIVVMSRS